MGVVDQIIDEPKGGAHRDADTAIQAVGETIQQLLNELKAMDGPTLIKDRQQKYLDLGSKGLAA